ncbi:hypothetical protein POM88_051421 [Heracleum sosnowskyi]|uniref:Uncharacterized protein n=1 Tax=Heracleum sosnowskyi TaxID=360622 RepID=A0AAD8H1W6_9APIA|nr:hypothetical protein POM88_051421 [Heracleum sosnowskyi]
MEEPKLYTCFEATNDLEEHVYVIYSAKLSDLHNKKLGSKPMFEFETAIKGLKSMGCGVFNSKIVLAGGLVTRDEEKEYQNGLITFDIQERSVSQECFPPMIGEKIRPVVFELYGRLYVLSTSTYVSVRSFGQMAKCFMIDYDEVIPFRGMATTYWKPGFSDVVVIYLSQEAYKPDGELCSYFADFGEGNFCLTVYDNVSIHVYMFTIDRLPNKENGALNIQLKRLVDHTYSYKELAFGGNKCVSLLGCFALPSDDRKKRVEESDLYRCHFPYAESGKEDGDLDLVLEEIKILRLDANCDIRNFEIPTDERRKCFEEEGLHRRHFLYGESVEKDDDISPRNTRHNWDADQI